jgi:hypothetical protein
VRQDLSFALRITLGHASVLIVLCPVAVARCPFQSRSSNTLMPPSVSLSSSLNLKTREIPLLILRPKSFGFFTGVLLSNFNEMLKREAPMTRVQQLQDTFSILQVRIYTVCLIYLIHVETSDVSAKRRKTRRRKVKLTHYRPGQALRFPVG